MGVDGTKRPAAIGISISRCCDALGYGEPVVTRVRKDLVPVLGHSDDRPGPGGNRLSRMEIRVSGGTMMEFSHA